MSPSQPEEDVSWSWKPYFERITRDPAVSRLRPVLERLLNNMEILVLLERGKVDQVVPLLQKRRKEGDPLEREAIDFLFAHRRLLSFQPVRLPRVRGILGIGSTFSGKQAYDPADRTFLGNRRLSLFGIPLLNQGDWVATEDKDGRVQLLARIPQEPQALARGRLKSVLGILLVVVALVGGLLASNPDLLRRSAPSSVHVVNGLEVPVKVTLQKDTFEVGPMSQASRLLPQGTFQIKSTVGERSLEQRELKNETGKGVFLYNVLGAGPVVSEEVTFNAQGRVSAKLESLVGKSVFPLDPDSELFKPVPSQLRMPPFKDSLTRRYVQLQPGGWRATLGKLATGDLAQMVVQELLIADPQNEALFMAAVASFWSAEPLDAVERARLFYSHYWDSVNAQRLLMTLIARKVGRENAVNAYQELQKIDPTKPLGAVLLATPLPPARAAALLQPAVDKAPDHFFARFALARARFRLKEFKAAAEQFAALEAKHPRAVASTWREHALALEALGQPSEALALLAKAGDLPGFAIDEDFARFYATLASRQPTTALPHPVDHYVAATVQFQRTPALAKALHLVSLAEGTPNEAMLAALEGEEQQNLVKLVWQMREDPASIVDNIRSLSSTALMQVDNIRLLLIAGELLRQDEKDGATKVLKALQIYAPWQDAVLANLEQGTPLPFPAEMDVELVAALKLVEARRTKVPAQAQKLLQEALALDLGKGAVTQAAKVWKL